MGEVYKARDTRLDRVVAVKVVSALLAGSPELRQRFEREAKTISQLNHPHICALYDVGHDAAVDYLVLEYVEGETLASRLARGAMDPADALMVAVQIADALDRAHRQGVIHRDLKPGNVMLSKSGAKLLDFGLAKAAIASASSSGVAVSAPPTFTTPITAQGTILGTFQYLAPEQIEGAEADARSDIWAFGCLVYEMLTGRRAFEGKSHASLIGAILKDEPPPVSSVQPLTPPALDQVIRRCLAKDPEDRWQTARDLVLQLKWVQQGSAAGVPAPVARRRRTREHLAWGVAAATTVAALAMAGYHYATLPPPAAPVTFTIDPPPGTMFAPATAPVAPFPAMSPDGNSIALLAQRPGEPHRIWLRSIGSLNARELAGTDGGLYPFWSPDSRFIAFFAEGRLKKVDVSGGSPQILCEVSQPEAGSWNEEGMIVFVGDRTRGLLAVPDGGGEPKQILSAGAGLTGLFGSATFLPGGRRFLFYNQDAVMLGSMDGSAPRRVFSSESRPQYIEPGYILFVRGESLFAQPFDAKRAALTGEPFPIADAVRLGQNGRSPFSASNTGAVVFRRGDSSVLTQLTWYSPTGNLLGTVGAPARYAELVLSPDGRRLAVAKREGANRDIWVLDLERDSSSRLTFDVGLDTHPVWSPDGRSIIFGSVRTVPGIYRKAASGAGVETLVLKANEARPHSWASDGTVLFDSSLDVWTGTLGALDSAKHLIANPAFTEAQARLSPDGRFIAYMSTESGRAEVYVATFPDLGDRWTVTSNAGGAPQWSPDGRKLYFTRLERGGDKTTLGVVEVQRQGDQLQFSQPKELVVIPLGIGAEQFTVAPDGRILVARAVDEQTSPDPLTVLLHWPQAVSKR